MASFDTNNLRRIAISSFAAAALAATCVGAAIVPARAATTPATIQDWQAAVERQIDRAPNDYASTITTADGRQSETLLAVRFTAEGDYAGAAIARSSGNRRLDDHALAVASRITYPALPETMRGRPQTVAMRLVFGRPDKAAETVAMIRTARDSVRLADARGAGTQVAAK